MVDFLIAFQFNSPNYAMSFSITGGTQLMGSIVGKKII